MTVDFSDISRMVVGDRRRESGNICIVEPITFGRLVSPYPLNKASSPQEVLKVLNAHVIARRANQDSKFDSEREKCTYASVRKIPLELVLNAMDLIKEHYLK